MKASWLSNYETAPFVSARMHQYAHRHARESVRPRSVWRELGCARMSTAGKHEPLCEEFAHGQVAVNLWLVLCLRARRVRMASARKKPQHDRHNRRHCLHDAGDVQRAGG